MENRSPGGGEAAAAVPDVVPDTPQNPPPEAMETDSLATATESPVPAPAPDALPPVANVEPFAAAVAAAVAAVPEQEVQNDVDVEMSGVVDMASTATAEEPKEHSTVPKSNSNSISPQGVSTNQEQTFPAAQEPHIKNELLSLNVSTVTPPPPMRNTTPPPLSNANVAEFATPPQPANRDLRNIILAAAASTAQSQGMFMQGPVPPSPVVEPGALHELGDLGTPGRRRSSAVGGIAGLEELRNREAAESEQNRFDQLIQATKLNGDEDPTPVVDAFLRLDFEDGNVYYIRNRSVVFGRAEGTAAGYYSQVGPDGSTIIETGPRGFGRSTSSGLTSMKREKKKRKKKKDEQGFMGKTKSTTSDSATPAPSRRGSAFAQPPRLRDPFGLADMDEEVDEPVIHLPLSNASIDGAPMPLRKNISRRHARLYYHTAKRRFELEIMGKNGAFVNEEYVQAGTTIVVEEKGMKVQIGGISFTVITPEIIVEPEPEEEPAPPPPPKFTGGKGKMSFAFHDENGDEVNYSEDEEMEDVDIDSGGEGSVEPDSGQQESDEDDEDQDEGGSGDDADEEDDQEDSSDEDEIDASSPESTKPARPRPMKSIGDIKRREEELKRDRDRIKELQRQLKEKEREKAEAEAEVLRQQRAQMRAQEREQELEREREMKRAQEREREKKRERERQRELAREREKEKLKEDKRNKKAMEKAMEMARQKELRQKEKELLRAAKEREKERQREAQREAKRQQKLHLPQPAGSNPAKKETKLILPTVPSNSTPKVSQSPAPAARPQPTLLLPQPSSTDTTPVQTQQPPPPPPQPQPLAQIEPTMDFSQQDHLYQDPYQQPSEMHHIQHPQPLQPMPMPQMYGASAPTIDPALYQTSAPHMMAPTMHHGPNMMAPYHHQPVVEKPRKEKPPPKPRKLRTPSPEINEADLPPESLIKPNISYVVMIHEAIMNSAEKVLSLPQIYKAIEAKYPYYKFKVTTQGWQSSVRHNLGQHKAFYKVDRAGKGWLWGIVDGVSIEKEKKGSSSKQAMSAHDMHGQAMQNGQMMGQMGQLQPGFQQQVYQGAGMQMMHPPTQQVPPPPSYMPAKPPVQPHAAVPQNPRAMEAPIPMPPVANGTPDSKPIIAVLKKIIAQSQSQVSSDPNARKTLDQLNTFLEQLSSGKAAPAVLETVHNIVSGIKPSPKPPASASPPVATPQLASSAPPPPSAQVASAPPPTQQYAPAVSASTPQAVSPAPSALAPAPPALAPTPPAQGQVGAKAPSQPPSQTPTITLANLHLHIKTMSAEERAKWTKKLLELKQQKAAAASGGAPPPPPPAPAAPAPLSAPLSAPVPAPAPAPMAAPTQAPVSAPAASLPAPSPHPENSSKAPHPTTGGKALHPATSTKTPVSAGKHPVTAGKAPMGLGAGKRPAGKMPLKAPIAEAIRNMPREMKEQVVAKAKASQALKRPLDSDGVSGGSGVAESGESPAKRMDVGTGKE